MAGRKEARRGGCIPHRAAERAVEQAPPGVDARAIEDRIDGILHRRPTVGLAVGVVRDGSGHEMTFATMVLGPFVLTRELMPMLERSGDARVITVTSGGMYTQSLHPDDLHLTAERYRGTIAYARAKRAQVVLTQLWAQRYRDRPVVFHAMHPGWADPPASRRRCRGSGG